MFGCFSLDNRTLEFVQTDGVAFYTITTPFRRLKDTVFLGRIRCSFGGGLGDGVGCRQSCSSGETNGSLMGGFLLTSQYLGLNLLFKRQVTTMALTIIKIKKIIIITILLIKLLWETFSNLIFLSVKLSNFICKLAILSS